MDTTRATLLERIRDPGDSIAWGEFHAIYHPLLFRYARARGLAHADAEDVAQRCMAALSRHIGGFDYDPQRGRFRDWLRTMVDHRVIDLLRKRRPLQARTDAFDRPDPSQRTPPELWERQWEKQHLAFCLEQLRDHLTAQSYQAFELYALEEAPAVEVAGRLGISTSQVYVIKSRTIGRLREMMNSLFGNERADY